MGEFLCLYVTKDELISGWSNLPGKVFATFLQQANRSLIHHPADIPDEKIKSILFGRIGVNSDAETAIPVSLWIADELTEDIQHKWKSWMSNWNLDPIDDEKEVNALLLGITRAESLQNDLAESNTLLISSLGEKWAFVFSSEKGSPKQIAGKIQISEQEAAWRYLEVAINRETHIPVDELDWERIREAHYPKLEHWLSEGEVKDSIHLYVKSSSNRDDTNVLVPIRFQDEEYQQILYGDWNTNFLHPFSQLTRLDSVHKIFFLGPVFRKGLPPFFRKKISSNFGSAKLFLWNKGEAGLLHEAIVSASIVILEEKLNHKLEDWKGRKYGPNVAEKEQFKQTANFSPRASFFEKQLASLIEFFEEKVLKESEEAHTAEAAMEADTLVPPNNKEDLDVPPPVEEEVPTPFVTPISTPLIMENDKKSPLRNIYWIAGIVVVALVLFFVTKQSLPFFNSNDTGPLPPPVDTLVSIPLDTLPDDSMTDEVTKGKETKDAPPKKPDEDPEKSKPVKPVIQEKEIPEKTVAKEPEKEKVRGVELAKTLNGAMGQLRSHSLPSETRIELVPAVIRHFFAKKEAEVFYSKNGKIIDFETVEEFLKTIVTQPKNQIKILDQTENARNKIVTLTVEKTVVSQ